MSKEKKKHLYDLHLFDEKGKWIGVERHYQKENKTK
tara:strand:+ start:439 stop:546 length:108 start_codon:yes stop_codon:yes gene_type:complete